MTDHPISMPEGIKSDETNSEVILFVDNREKRNNQDGCDVASSHLPWSFDPCWLDPPAGALNVGFFGGGRWRYESACVCPFGSGKQTTCVVQWWW